MTIRTFITASIGVLAIAAGLSGLPLERESAGTTVLRLCCRAMLVVGGLLFVNPSLATDVIGVVLIACEILADRLALRRLAAKAA